MTTHVTETHVDVVVDDYDGLVDTTDRVPAVPADDPALRCDEASADDPAAEETVLLGAPPAPSRRATRNLPRWIPKTVAALALMTVSVLLYIDLYRGVSPTVADPVNVTIWSLLGLTIGCFVYLGVTRKKATYATWMASEAAIEWFQGIKNSDYWTADDPAMGPDTWNASREKAAITRLMNSPLPTVGPGSTMYDRGFRDGYQAARNNLTRFLDS